ncbi:MAG: cupin domain-containing protein [bacterium]|nr:cupin domain-containing protein [bacterium]
MRGYIENIERLTLENTNFRKVIYTAKNSQLVLMSLKPGEDIGAEVHNLDQFIRCEAGSGLTILNGAESPITDGSAIVVPAGVEHNVINTSTDADLKLYTIYSPPEHKDGVVHITKADALADEGDYFGGKTTE